MKIIIYLIFLQGLHSIPISQHKQFVHDIKQETRLHNVIFKIIEGGDDEHQNTETLNPENIMYDYASDAKLLHRYRHLHHKVFIGAPKFYGNSYWTLGGCDVGAFCDSNSKLFAFCSQTDTNANGISRYNESVVACAHEIFHGFGATHQMDSINLMNPDALAFAHDSYRLKVLNRSRKQLCVR